MDSLVYMFRAGGSMMWAVVGSDCTCCSMWVPAVLAAMLLRRGSNRRAAQAFVVVFALGTMVPLFFGALGWQLGRAMTDQAVLAVDPEYAERVREAGHAEAELPLRFGLMSTLGLLLAAVLPVLAAFRPEAEPEPEPEEPEPAG